jgi:pyridoxamine 5'-phosphate oxidase
MSLPDDHPAPLVPGLAETEIGADPLRQFAAWFDEAHRTIADAEAMALATATPDGVPSARMVLLKGFDERGFIFYTNYDSRKGRELAANPCAALVLYWHPLQRQVRIEGTVARTTREESERYFASRPFGSRVAAAISHQSTVVPNRRVLEERFVELAAQLEGQAVPMPPDWGGFRLTPSAIEFWQGRPSRLHDRLRYTRRPDSTWLVERLSP